MAQKCVHKGCGKVFSDPEEPCVYHPGPPEFHEGQKGPAHTKVEKRLAGWKCCKPRVLTFDEFLEIPPCTTGKHSTVDDTPAEFAPPKKAPEDTLASIPAPKPISVQPAGQTTSNTPARAIAPVKAPSPAPSPAPPESESDDPSTTIPEGISCKRKGCKGSYDSKTPRDEEECIHHPGVPIFHEGSKGWTCCKRRVLEFEEFLKIEGCKTKKRHLFVGKGRPKGEEKLETVRSDFYQTPSTVIASFYLKKIDKAKAKVDFSSPTTLDLDLPTSDNKRFVASLPLYGPIDQSASQFKILGTKLELNLVKADGASWPVLRSDESRTGEIIQVGRAGRA
ncbi:MAG: hypothetical protein Q9227_009529 [Pyrenula ochraceoflavens]